MISFHFISIKETVPSPSSPNQRERERNHKFMGSIVHQVVIVVILLGVLGGTATAGYSRPPPRRTIVTPRSADAGPTTPEQVHISTVGADKMRITWITEKSVPTKVEYAAATSSPSSFPTSSSSSSMISTDGSTSTYKYLMYESGHINEVVIGPLHPNTTYYYHCGGHTSQQFALKTPPSRFPIKFAVTGDLGQTEWTKSTLDHISKSNYDILLLPGDLSYADFVQPLWDSFGRLVSSLASQRPWMVTQGNHEVEKIHVIHDTPFTAYNARWHMPFEESGSDSNLYYSFDAAGRGVHVVVLGSYADFGVGSDQYNWLAGDLNKIDRAKSPWVVVIIHAPWYNSNEAHQGEKESVDMKAAMESLMYAAKVDLVFAGHVHAYERFDRVFQDQPNECGPVYINIGDGGNREGLAKKYMDPAPKISLFREASFGHGILEVFNATTASWAWRRNQDDENLVADSVWLTSFASKPAACQSKM